MILKIKKSLHDVSKGDVQITGIYSDDKYDIFEINHQENYIMFRPINENTFDYI